MSCERVFVVILPNGKEKNFTSPSAFDGYVKGWRENGYSATFSGPFFVTIAP